MESNVDAKRRNARRHRRIVYFLLDLPIGSREKKRETTGTLSRKLCKQGVKQKFTLCYKLLFYYDTVINYYTPACINEKKRNNKNFGIEMLGVIICFILFLIIFQYFVNFFKNLDFCCSNF